MINIIRTNFRNFKNIIIFISMLAISLLILTSLEITQDYYQYRINEVYGILKENRTYAIYNFNPEILEEIEKIAPLENYEQIDSLMGPSIITIKYYRDSYKLRNYLKETENRYQLIDDSKMSNIQYIETNIDLVNKLEIVFTILLFLIIYLIMKNQYYSNLKNVSLLKILGYQDIKIHLIYFLENIIYLLSIFIINIVIIYIFHFSYLFLNNPNLISYLKNINILKIIYPSIIFITISIIINYIPNLIHTRKLNLIETINE